MNYEITNLTDEIVQIKLIEDLIKLDVKNSIVEIILTDDKRIHEINKLYRGVDRATDVISFAFQDTFDVLANDIVNLGEIYISLDKTKAQAKEYGHSFERELGFNSSWSFAFIRI